MKETSTTVATDPIGEHNQLNLLQVIGSVLAAFFDVQSSKNRERDFRAGKPAQFILMGFLMTMVLFLCIYGVVHLVLHLGQS